MRSSVTAILAELATLADAGPLDFGYRSSYMGVYDFGSSTSRRDKGRDI